MRLGVPLSPAPPPSVALTSAASYHGKMVVSAFMALLLPCAGMSLVFLIYISLLWYSAKRRLNIINNNNNNNNIEAAGNDVGDYREPVKPVAENGLSKTELDRLPKVTGKEMAAMCRWRNECAVCLEEIETGQPVRLVPGCNHGFHLQCADTWLSKHSVCPVCRTKLVPKLLEEASTDESPC